MASVEYRAESENHADADGSLRRMKAVVKGSTQNTSTPTSVAPPFAAGHWLPEMVAAAGGSDVLGRRGEPSFSVTWDAVEEKEPELVVVAACGYDARRGAAEADAVELALPWIAVDANAYYSRPAPRVADGVRQLGFLLHPEVCEDPGLPAVYGTSRRTAETIPSAAKPAA